MEKKYDQDSGDRRTIEDSPSVISYEVDEVLKSIKSVDFFLENPEPEEISRQGIVNALENLKDHLKRAKRYLDIGSSHGYLTLACAKLMKQPDAVAYRLECISGLVNEVKTSIEKNHKEYLKSGKIILAEGSVKNGWKDYAPYDVIYVESASSIGMDETIREIPMDFVRQLARGGRMVITIRSCELLVIDKDENGEITEQLKKNVTESSQDKSRSESKKTYTNEQKEEQVYELKNRLITQKDFQSAKVLYPSLIQEKYFRDEFGVGTFQPTTLVTGSECQLCVIIEGEPFVGSGSQCFIGEDSVTHTFILTCAHNLIRFSELHNGKKSIPESACFHLGKTSPENYNYLASISKFFIYSAYSDLHNILDGCDIAIGFSEANWVEMFMEIKGKDISFKDSSLDWYLSYMEKESPQVGDTIRVIGYPGFPAENNGYLYDMAGTITGFVKNGENQVILSNVITTSGFSGSPVYLKRGSKWALIGVHVGFLLNDKTTVVTAITAKIYKWIEEKVKESSLSYKWKPREMFIKINDWNTPRQCLVTQDSIKLQIATCYPCSVCDMRVNFIRKSLNDSVKCYEHIEDSFFYLIFPIEQAKRGEFDDVIAFLSRVFPSVRFTVVSGVTAVRQKYDFKQQIFNWDKLLEESQISLTKRANSNLMKRLKNNSNLLIAALRVREGDVEEALNVLEEFIIEYPEAKIESLKLTGFMAPGLREMAQNKILEGMGAELKLFAIFSSRSRDSVCICMNGDKIENSIKEVRSMK